ncbi:MAG: hypothetical protein Q9198_007561 [Flavoplaca austrocitrina]
MSYPAPTAPDMERCFTYFNDPARLTDCNTAFNLLPDGPQPITWNNHPAQQSDPSLEQKSAKWLVVLWVAVLKRVEWKGTEAGS